VSFTPDGHRCTLLIENREEGAREMHEGTISDAGVAKVEAVIPTNDLPSPCIDAGGTRERLLQGKNTLQLAVSRAVRGQEEQCTCTAVAYFDSYLKRSLRMVQSFDSWCSSSFNTRPFDRRGGTVGWRHPFHGVLRLRTRVPHLDTSHRLGVFPTPKSGESTLCCSIFICFHRQLWPTLLCHAAKRHKARWRG
jgi:hypothetical protein